MTEDEQHDQAIRFEGRDPKLESAVRAELDASDRADWAELQKPEPSNVVPFRRRAVLVKRSDAGGEPA